MHNKLAKQRFAIFNFARNTLELLKVCCYNEREKPNTSRRIRPVRQVVDAASQVVVTARVVGTFTVL